jgi:hypothetical protein
MWKKRMEIEVAHKDSPAGSQIEKSLICDIEQEFPYFKHKPISLPPFPALPPPT